MAVQRQIQSRSRGSRPSTPARPGWTLCGQIGTCRHLLEKEQEKMTWLFFLFWHTTVQSKSCQVLSLHAGVILGNLLFIWPISWDILILKVHSKVRFRVIIQKKKKKNNNQKNPCVLGPHWHLDEWCVSIGMPRHRGFPTDCEKLHTVLL